jgi:hypothetical protein
MSVGTVLLTTGSSLDPNIRIEKWPSVIPAIFNRKLH